MNKTDLVHRLSDATNLTLDKTQEVVDALFGNRYSGGIIADAVCNDGGLILQGFGSFSAHARAERKGVNPATQDDITIPATTVVRFKAGKMLAARVAGR